MRWVPAAGVLFLSAGCLCGGGGQTGGGGGGSSGSGGGSGVSATLSYDVVSATGHWSLTGTASGCRQTTTSTVDLTLTPGGTSTATFLGSQGFFTAFASVTQTTSARSGSDTCPGTAGACPSSPDSPSTVPTFLTVTLDGPLTPSPPAGLAVVPTFDVQPPQLCDGQSYDVAPAYKRGKPVTIAQLASGRFVVEGQGSAPILASTPDLGDPDPPELVGELTWSFSIVFQSQDYDASHAVPSPDLTTYDLCLLDIPPDETTLEAAEDAYDAGQTDIALNATGCRRLKVERGSGAVQIEHELTFGTLFTIDSSGAPVSAPQAAVTFRLIADSSGVHELNTAPDGGFATTERTFASDDSWTGTVTQEHSPDGTATRQYELVPGADAGTMIVTVTDPATGDVEDSFETSSQQQTCFTAASMDAPECAGTSGAGGGAACTGTITRCNKQQVNSITPKLLAAVSKGMRCLEKQGFKDFDAKGKAPALIASNLLHLFCDSNPCDAYGSLNTKRNKDGSNDLIVNTAKNNPAELASTLFHEMLHGDADGRFVHNDPLVDAAHHACKHTSVDRTYACEAMCFDPAGGGSCACMRCLGPKSGAPSMDLCNKCNALGSCPTRHEGGNAVASAVGGWCDRTKEFCDTKAECDSACMTLGNSCTSPFKNTCDPMCN
jgi:hypothetical protein